MAPGKDLLALPDPWTLPGTCSPSYPCIPSCPQQTRGAGCLGSGALSLTIQWPWEAGPLPLMYWFPWPFFSGAVSPSVCFTIIIIYPNSCSIPISQHPTRLPDSPVPGLCRPSAPAPLLAFLSPPVSVFDVRNAWAHDLQMAFTLPPHRCATVYLTGPPSLDTK